MNAFGPNAALSDRERDEVENCRRYLPTVGELSPAEARIKWLLDIVDRLAPRERVDDILAEMRSMPECGATEYWVGRIEAALKLERDNA